MPGLPEDRTEALLQARVELKLEDRTLVVGRLELDTVLWCIAKNEAPEPRPPKPAVHKKKKHKNKPNQRKPKRTKAILAFAATDAFLQTYEWRKLRLETLLLHGRKCQCCGRSPADGIILNVDHIKSRRRYPELALDINNTQVLCEDCNHGKGNRTIDFRSN